LERYRERGFFMFIRGVSVIVACFCGIFAGSIATPRM